MKMTEENLAKQFAAESAVGRVQNGMVIGLGSRATAEMAIRILGDKVQHGFQIVGVPISHESEELTRSLGIRVSTLVEYPQPDLIIDGTDEVELDSLDLIKGRCGALLGGSANVGIPCGSPPSSFNAGCIS